VVLDEPIDQIVVLLQRHELERGSSVDSHHDRFVMAAMSVLTQVRFSFTEQYPPARRVLRLYRTRILVKLSVW